MKTQGYSRKKYPSIPELIEKVFEKEVTHDIGFWNAKMVASDDPYSASRSLVSRSIQKNPYDNAEVEERQASADPYDARVEISKRKPQFDSAARLPTTMPAFGLARQPTVDLYSRNFKRPLNAYESPSMIDDEKAHSPVVEDTLESRIGRLEYKLDRVLELLSDIHSKLC